MNENEKNISVSDSQKPNKVKKEKASQTVQSNILKTIVLAAGYITIAVSIGIVIYILVRGLPEFKFELFALEYTTENTSMMPAIINTLFVIAITLLIAVPIGVGAAIYLSEYANRGSKVVKVIRLATETLSGIPSIVYGLFGMLCFTEFFGWGLSLLSGSCTLAIMILPVIERTTEEALLAVDDSYREGSFGLGAGKLRTVFKIVLPSAVPGIISGIVLGTGRVVGETAALIYTAGTVAQIAGPLNTGRTLAVHLYALWNEGISEGPSYATAVVLLVVVLLLNYLSRKLEKIVTKTRGEK